VSDLAIGKFKLATIECVLGGRGMPWFKHVSLILNAYFSFKTLL